MTIPRGFTRCDECEGTGIDSSCPTERGPCGYTVRCPTCSGSGLVPTEKLREEIKQALFDVEESSGGQAGLNRLADAVLAKVAEHLGGRE